MFQPLRVTQPSDCPDFLQVFLAFVRSGFAVCTTMDLFVTLRQNTALRTPISSEVQSHSPERPKGGNEKGGSSTNVVGRSHLERASGSNSSMVSPGATRECIDTPFCKLLLLVWRTTVQHTAVCILVVQAETCQQVTAAVLPSTSSLVLCPLPGIRTSHQRDTREQGRCIMF